ncbi:hypothetical protein HanRHA438_Chr05g0203491 [Helianthus annuus]|nr:hypothetical protein HanHA89_Chr05g0172611 [Helianthus annuus]KAJ0917214.1 hypothetical protein HanRHA438_Chr05g0203491 [Helianthus annuus]
MLPLIFTMTRVEVGRVNRSHMVEPLVSILLMRLSRCFELENPWLGAHL